MKKLILASITLTAIGVAVKVIKQKANSFYPERITSKTISGKKINIINNNHESLS